MNLGTAGLDPVLQARVLKVVSEERRGAASGTFYLGADIGQAAGPIAGGILAQGFGYDKMYSLFIIPLAVVSAIFIYVQLKAGRHK